VSSPVLAIVSLLSAATIAGLVLWLLRPHRQANFRCDDGTAIFHAGVGHAAAHHGGDSPACDASGSCGADGGGGAAF
jgi:hypothetical protein